MQAGGSIEGSIEGLDRFMRRMVKSIEGLCALGGFDQSSRAGDRVDVVNAAAVSEVRLYAFRAVKTKTESDPIVSASARSIIDFFRLIKERTLAWNHHTRSQKFVLFSLLSLSSLSFAASHCSRPMCFNTPVLFIYILQHRPSVFDHASFLMARADW